MKLKLSETIRALRKRDGRTQEALAEALGISSQAVSRWEMQNAYPDIEIIPAIANYFHVTIDELFGYNNDREVKISAVLDTADKAICSKTSLEEIIDMLREAAGEFPAEARILYRLGYALALYGEDHHGARQIVDKKRDYAFFDIEYNKKNEHFRESLNLLEQALSLGLDGDEKTNALITAVKLCTRMGYSEKAAQIAGERDTLRICSELLRIEYSEGAQRAAFIAEAEAGLLSCLVSVIIRSVTTDSRLANSKEAVDKLLTAAHFAETLMKERGLGELHGKIGELYLRSAEYAGKLGHIEDGKRYFDLAVIHYSEYNAQSTFGGWQPMPSDMMENFINNRMPDALKHLIKQDQRYFYLYQ